MERLEENIMAEKQTKLEVVGDNAIDQQPIQVPKPEEKPSLDKFKSKSAATIGGVETLLTGLPHHTIKEAFDFVRLHDNEADYWSPELCFVNVPILGQKRDTLHLIAEDIAMQYLPSSRIQRFRLALATKPHDSFFLCHVPSRNLDNQWNQTSLDGCVKGKTRWVLVTSRREEGYESYKITYTRDEEPFPKPNWPSQSLFELILRTFDNGRQIEDAKHPGLLRLIGAQQNLS
jgi:hypothetical protein